MAPAQKDQILPMKDRLFRVLVCELQVNLLPEVFIILLNSLQVKILGRTLVLHLFILIVF